MRGWLALLALCGCNQAFNLQSTQLIDAAEPPPPIDAPPPPMCPAIGTAPRFSDDLRQIPPRNCDAYSISDTKIAMALCNSELVRGDADGEMPQKVAMDPMYQTDFPRLAPDGDHVFLSHFDYGTYVSTMVEFRWNGTALEKVQAYEMPHDSTYGENFSISTPSRDRHLVYSDTNSSTGATEVVEIADTGTGKFAEVARYPLTELGDMVGPLEKPSLSADGLRIVFLNSSNVATGAAGGGGGASTGSVSGTVCSGSYCGGWCGYTSSVLMYADRPDTSSHFGKATMIDTVPDQIDWPYMTEDCGRIYVSALNRIFYFKQ